MAITKFIYCKFFSLYMEDQRAQSEFNFAIDFLNRLNTWLYAASEAAINLDPFNWFHALMVIRRELFSDMGKEEKILCEQYKEKIHSMLPRALQKIQFGGSKEISNELYKELDGLEIFLRDVLTKSGYKTKFKDDPRFSGR